MTKKNMDKIWMDNRWIKLGALFGIIASALIIFLGINFTPDFVARNLSPDGILEPSTVFKVNIIRMGAAIAGLLILIFSIAFIVAPHLLYSMYNSILNQKITGREVRFNAKMTKKNKVIILLLVFGTFSFLFNYLIQSKFDRYEVLDQINVLFGADPSLKLNRVVTGHAADAGFFVVHPNFINFFHPPIRLGAKVIAYFIEGNWEKELEIRRMLALFGVPIFSAFNAMVIALIFSRLNFTLIQVCMLTTLSIFSFTQIIFGSMPELFALNGFFITICFLYCTRYLNSKKLNWAMWTIIGVFGMGITITNIVILIIIFFTSIFSVSRDINLSIKNTIMLICIVTFLTFTFALGSSLLYKNRPLRSTAMEVTKKYTKTYLRTDSMYRILKYPFWVATSITPYKSNIVKFRESSSMKKLKKKKLYGGKYHHTFKIKPDNPFRSKKISIIIFTIGITCFGAINLLKNGMVFQSLAISSLLILVYNGFFHAFWGGQYFLYSQHWICSLIILMSGIFLTKRPYLLPITSIFSAYLVYVIYNNLVILNDIFHFLRNYSS
jgi:hypothetical protein